MSEALNLQLQKAEAMAAESGTGFVNRDFMALLQGANSLAASVHAPHVRHTAEDTEAVQRIQRIGDHSGVGGAGASGAGVGGMPGTASGAPISDEPDGSPGDPDGFMQTYHDRIIATVVEESKQRSLGQCEAELERHVTAEWQRTKNDLLVCLGLQTVLPAAAPSAPVVPGGPGGAAAATTALGTLARQPPLPPTALPPSLAAFAEEVDSLVTASSAGTGMGGAHTRPVVTKLASAARSTLRAAGVPVDEGAPAVLQPWEALRAVVREEAGSGAKAGVYAQAYLGSDLTTSPLGGPLGTFWAGGSTAFLESYSSSAATLGLQAAKQRFPALQGTNDAPALIDRAAAYMALRLGGDLVDLTPPEAPTVHRAGLGGAVPFWALLWHLLRMGLRTPGTTAPLPDGRGHAALDLAREVTGSTPSAPTTLVLALEAALTVHLSVQQGEWAAGQLPGEAAAAGLSPAHLQAVRDVQGVVGGAGRQVFAPATLAGSPVEGDDVYAVAVLNLLAGQVPDFDLVQPDTVDTVDVERGASDFLWTRLWFVAQSALVAAAAPPGTAALYTMAHVSRELVLVMGAAMWDPQQRNPYEYAKLCLLGGQVEVAVAYLASHGHTQNPVCHLEDAVHLALAAHHYGLLRTVSPQVLREAQCTVGVALNAVGVAGNDPVAGRGLYADKDTFFSAGALALDLTTLLEKLRQARLRSEPYRAAQYFSLLGSVGAGGAASSTAAGEVRDREQLLLELLGASKAYDALLGSLTQDLLPRMDGTLAQVAANASYTTLAPAALQDLAALCARAAAGEGRWQDAFTLQLRAGQSAAALSVLVHRLAATSPDTTSTERSWWVRIAGQFLASELGRLGDALPGAPAPAEASGGRFRARLAQTAVAVEGFPYSVTLTVLRRLMALVDAANAVEAGEQQRGMGALRSAGLVPDPAAPRDFWQRTAHHSAGAPGGEPLAHPAMRAVLFYSLRLAMTCLAAQYSAAPGRAPGPDHLALRSAAHTLHTVPADLPSPLTPAQVGELRRLGGGLL